MTSENLIIELEETIKNLKIEHSKEKKQLIRIIKSPKVCGCKTNSQCNVYRCSCFGSGVSCTPRCRCNPELCQNMFIEKDKETTDKNNNEEVTPEKINNGNNGKDESTKKQQSHSIQDLLKETTALYAELHLDVSKTYDQVPERKVEEMLQADLQNLERMKKERMMILKELLTKEHDICKKLGCKVLDVTRNSLPTEQELESFKLYLEKQDNEKIRLENVFTDERLSIIKMMGDLDKSPSSPFEELICNNPEEVVLSASNMTKLIDLRNELNKQVQDTKCCVEKMKEKLLALWKYLDEPDDVCQLFLERHSGYSVSIVDALNAEITLYKDKRECKMFQNCIAIMRDELVKLWDLSKYSEIERKAFVPFHSNAFAEDLLKLHELEVERLRKFYNDNQTIFKLLEQRERLITKTKELLQQANNPDRYHNHGGQLLMEEKERRVTQEKLLEIEAKLKQLINDYETKHNQIFTIDGISLEDYLAETSKISLENESTKKARKEAEKIETQR